MTKPVANPRQRVTQSMVRREVVPHPSGPDFLSVAFSNRLPDRSYSIQFRYPAEVQPRYLRLVYPHPIAAQAHAIDVVGWLAATVQAPRRDVTAEQRKATVAANRLESRLRVLLGRSGYVDFRDHDWNLQAFITGPGRLVWEKAEPLVSQALLKQMGMAG